MNAVDVFAGPGGWDAGINDLVQPLGIEIDEAACATRAAAGLRSLQGDVAALDPLTFAPCDMLIASPPCPTFSSAGARSGHEVVDIIMECARALARGSDTRAEARAEAYTVLEPLALQKERDRAQRRGDVANYESARARARADAAMSLLVVEPLRYALALRPRRLAFEQVPLVLDIWRAFSHLLEEHGYRCWAGTLSAEQYGVPQTRERAFLLASLDGQPHPPVPTHQRYESGVPAAEQHTLEGVLLPWVSMAEALGWTGEVGFPRRNDRDDGGDYRERDLRDAEEPAFALTEKTRSWVRLEERQAHGASREQDEPAPTLTSSMDNGNFRFLVNTGRDWKEGGDREDAQTFDAEEQPAPTVDATGRWKVRTGNFTAKSRDLDGTRTKNGSVPYERDVEDPAPTLDTDARRWTVERPAPTIVTSRRSKDGIVVGRQLPEGEGENVGGWGWERPATVVQGDPRVFSPGGHIANDGRDNSKMVGRSENAIRVTLEDAAVLQGFPSGYPFQGTRTKQFEQVGNAVPPPLARAVIVALAGDLL